MGISIELHLTFIIFFSLFLAAGITNFLFLGLIFTIVLAHELAHSITAKLSGIPVPKITLLPIGGLATIELPEDPMLELRVSMVGPLFNFFMAGICIILLYASGYGLIAYSSLIGGMEGGIFFFNVENTLSLLIWMNLLLGSFNMLPAFPMDGGRVLRSILALWIDYIQATRIALMIGQIIFIFFMIAGLIIGNFWWILIGFFLFSVGPNELKFIGLRKAFRNTSIGEITEKDLSYVNDRLTISEFIRLIARPNQRYYPVVDAIGVLKGILDIEDLKEIDTDKLGDRILNYTRREVALMESKMDAEKNMKALLSNDVVIVTKSGKFIGLLIQEDLSKSTLLNKLIAREEA